MRVRYLALFAVPLLACGASIAPSPPPPASVVPAAAIAPPRTEVAPPVTPSIDPAAVRAAGISSRIRFLADDLLEGRFTGSRGHAIAERYVASELQLMGAEPGGDAGTFLQTVPMRGAIKDPARTSLVVHSRGAADKALKLEEDFILSSDMRESTAAAWEAAKTLDLALATERAARYGHEYRERRLAQGLTMEMADALGIEWNG